MMDRGFIKWQPFNSLTTPKDVLSDMDNYEEAPALFPEELENIAKLIQTAYYGHNKITITFYENNHLEILNTYIINIYPTYNTLKLATGKIISFNQVYTLKECLPK